MARRLTRVVHTLDHTIGRLATVRRVLVEMRTPVYHAVLSPICDALQEIPATQLFFTSEYPERIIPLVGAKRFIAREEAEWRRFDVYFNADPWAAARLRRCARRVSYFHGVAGKYDLDDPSGLPMGYQYYDRVGFINRDRLERYIASRVVTPAQARLVGYPKLDRLASGKIDGAAERNRLGLSSAHPTVLYAPTYSPASSLHLAGEDIVQGLAAAGFNVIIKLHDRSLDPDPKYNGGVDWRVRMRSIERPGRIAYVETADATPLMAAADLMVTDHSSVGFEFLVLDRPLLIFDAPGLTAGARINPQKVSLLRSAADVVGDSSALSERAQAVLRDPAAKSVARQRVAREMFHEPGTATARAVGLIREMLELKPHASAAEEVGLLS